MTEQNKNVVNRVHRGHRYNVLADNINAVKKKNSETR